MIRKVMKKKADIGFRNTKKSLLVQIFASFELKNADGYELTHYHFLKNEKL